MHHSVTFNFGSAKMCSPARFGYAILETYLSYDKDIWIAATDYYMHFYINVLFPLTAILKLINFSLLINAAMLLLNCLVFILYLYILFSQLNHYLYLYISDTALKLSQSLYCFTTSISHGAEKYFPGLLGTGISDAIVFI